MINRTALTILLTTTLLAALIPFSGVYAARQDTAVDLDNDEMDVTLFRGAANNSYFVVYFNALPTAGADNVEMQTHAVNLRPERDVTLHVEIYNPDGSFTDNLHPVTNTRAATTLIPNSSFKFAPHLPEILEALLPFVKRHTPKGTDK